MSAPFSSRRLRGWELALTALVTAAPFLLPLASPVPMPFAGTARAQAMEKPDTSRLITVGGALTEIVYALGEQGRLVGRDSTSIYPPETASLPDVGYMRQLSPEGVIAVNPKAILAVEGSGPPEALALLREADVAFKMVPETFDAESILAKIRTVGAFLGVPEKAEALAGTVEAELSLAMAAAADHKGAAAKRVLFILSMQGGKIMASGTGTAANGIIELSGAINAVGSFEGYKPMTDEAVIEAKPDIILMMTREGNHAASNADLFVHPALALTPAAQEQAVIRMDGLHLLGFGPRTASAIRDLNAAIYGTGPDGTE